MNDIKYCPICKGVLEDSRNINENMEHTLVCVVCEYSEKVSD